jgi:hypothetical protein
MGMLADQADSVHDPSVREREREAGGGVDDAIIEEPDAVATGLGAAAEQQLARRRPVARVEALHVRGGGVAWRARVDHHNAAAGAPEHERGAPTRGPTTDDRHVKVELSVSMRRSIDQSAARREGFVAVSGKRR